MTLQPNHKVLIVAAEASSTLYAERLIEHWRFSELNIEAYGIGSKEMVKGGFRAIAYAEDLAVVGLVEILAQYKKIKQAFELVVAEVTQEPPACALLMDYPGFNLRLAKVLKAKNIPVIYYISPQIWAWRQKRVEIVKRYVDKMLVVFPFEKQFYAKHGVKAHFVGHPLIKELELFGQTRISERHKYGFKAEDLILGIMPGSRQAEIKYNLPAQLAAAKLFLQAKPQAKVMLLLAPSLERSVVAPYLTDITYPIRVVQGEPFAMIDMTDLVLCTSGTATLMVGLLAKPLVIMYRAHPVTAWLGRKLLKSYFGLVNVIMNAEVVPERLQEQASPQHLVQLLLRYVQDDDYRTEVVAKLQQLKSRLGERDATSLVTEHLLDYIQK